MNIDTAKMILILAQASGIFALAAIGFGVALLLITWAIKSTFSPRI